MFAVACGGGGGGMDELAVPGAKAESPPAAACPVVRVGRISSFDAFVDQANARCAKLKTPYFECAVQIKEYFEKCNGGARTLEGIAWGLAAAEGVTSGFAYDGELTATEMQSALSGMDMDGWLYALRSIIGSAEYRVARAVSVTQVSPYMEKIEELLFLSYTQSADVHLVRVTTIQEAIP